MTEEERIRLHAILRGRVQGVGFRAFVVDKGQALGATGWARNRWDGSVEVVAEADRSTLEELLRALQRGPRMANVSNVEQEWQQASGEFKSFRVKPTS